MISIFRALSAAAFILAGATAMAAEPISYAAFTAQHGEQKQVTLAPGGRFFLSSMEAADKGITLWLWRVEGEQAYQVKSWTLPPNPNFLIDMHTAVAPDGTYVAISTPSSDGPDRERLRFHRVADDDRDTFDPSDIGHKSGDLSRTCGLVFLDADRLLVCHAGRLPDRMADPDPTSTLVLVTGFARGKPRIQNASISHNGTYNSVGYITRLRTEHNGIVGAISEHAHFVDVTKFANYSDALLISIQGDKITFPFVGLGKKKLGLTPGNGPLISAVAALSPTGNRLIIIRNGETTIHSLSGGDDIRSAVSPFRITAVSSDGTLLSDSYGGLYLVGKGGLIRIFGAVSSTSSVALTDDGRTMLVVAPNKVVRRDITPQRLDAARAFDEGISMIKAGFAQPGFARLRQSIDLDPDYWAGHVDPNSEMIAIDVSEGRIKAPLSEVGGFLLHLIQAQSRPMPGGRLGVAKFDKAKDEWRIDGVDKCFTQHPLRSAGIRDGDRILSVAGQSLADQDFLKDLMKTLQPGSRVEITTARDGGTPVVTEIPVLQNVTSVGYHFANLSYFALLAAQAGHSGITMQVEAQMRKMVAEFDLCQIVITQANLLGGLARAMNAGAEAGYNYILAQGGLVHEGKRNLGAAHAEIFATAAAPLYADRNKLAFLMETTPDKLPRPSLSPRAPQPYPDLTGRIIEPSGASVSPAPVLVPAAERNTLAPPSGSGQILD